MLSLYPNNLNNWEFGKKAPQNFYSEQATIAERQGASENENSEVKPTQPKTNFSSCLGIKALRNRCSNFCDEIRIWANGPKTNANKAVTQVLLDKITHRIPEIHPDYQKIRQYECFASFQGQEIFIDILGDLIQNPHTPEKAIPILKEIQRNLTSSFLLAAFCDMCKYEMAPQVANAVMSGRMDQICASLKSNLFKEEEYFDEINLIAENLFRPLQELKLNETMIIDAGLLTHIAKMWIKKEPNGSLTIYPADSMLQQKPIGEIPLEKMSKESLRELITRKLKSDFDSWDEIAKKGEVQQHLKDSWIHTSFQKLNSCALQSNMRVMRVAFFEKFNGSKEGWELYKGCMALVRQTIYQQNRQLLSPEVAEYARDKLTIHERFIIWMDDLKEEGGFSKVKEGFFDELADLKVDPFQLASWRKEIETLRPLEALNTLHEHLVNALQGICRDDLHARIAEREIPDYLKASYQRATENALLKEMLLENWQRFISQKRSQFGQIQACVFNHLPFKKLWVPYLCPVFAQINLWVVFPYLLLLDRADHFSPQDRQEFQKIAEDFLEFWKKEAEPSVVSSIIARDLLIKLALRMELPELLDRLLLFADEGPSHLKTIEILKTIPSKHLTEGLKKVFLMCVSQIRDQDVFNKVVWGVGELAEQFGELKIKDSLLERYKNRLIQATPFECSTQLVGSIDRLLSLVELVPLSFLQEVLNYVESWSANPWKDRLSEELHLAIFLKEGRGPSSEFFDDFGHILAEGIEKTCQQAIALAKEFQRFAKSPEQLKRLCKKCVALKRFDLALEVALVFNPTYTVLEDFKVLMEVAEAMLKDNHIGQAKILLQHMLQLISSEHIQSHHSSVITFLTERFSAILKDSFPDLFDEVSDQLSLALLVT
jgi:hypothetical protein